MNDSVAYFSMEIGIKPEIKTYSGGLGVLAGDTLKSAADLGMDFTGVTLLYRDGYFKQVLDEKGFQQEEPQQWNYEEILEDTGERVEIEIGDESVTVKAYKYVYEGEKGSVEVFFLSTDLEENSEKVRNFTSQLYAGGDEMRLCQETVLGIAGAKLIDRLKSPDIYHMNEGHSALLTLEASGDFVFTTHTPVAAGHDSFSPELVRNILGERADQLDLAHELNMTELALEHSDYQNAVSEKHREVSEKMFPQYQLEAITNGVHANTWAQKDLTELFNEYVEKWREDPERLSKAMRIPDKELWHAKKNCKKKLVENVEASTGKEMDEGKFTLGFARRATSYKRPTLIFRDTEALEKLGEKYGGLQIVIGGKAHPHDTRGKELIQKILNYSEMLENVDVYFIEDYGMGDSAYMLSGCDLWLNNPVRGQEASGTSGMKAAINGTPQLSVLDGWWLEGHIEDVTGWSIGEDYVEGENQDEVDSQSIYRKLDHIISKYSNERKEWLDIMRNCIALNGSYFNTNRMVKEYATEAYN